VNKNKDISFAYRPIVLASFVVENLFVKNSPQVSHFINVLLYAIICVLVFNFLILLFPTVNKFVLLFTITIFIIHPLHTEPVDNIKSRDELLTGLFGILALIQYLKFLKHKKAFSVILLIIFSLLGIFSKLSFLIYAALIPVIYLIFSEKIKIKKLIIVIILIVIPYFLFRIGKYFLLDHDTLIRHYEFFENPLFQTSLLMRIPAGFSIMMDYLFILIYPFKLSFYYGYNVVPIHSWSNLLPYIGILFYGGLGYLFFKIRRQNSFLAFGIAVLIINSFAVSNILSPLPGVVAERFFFFGVLAFAMGIAYFSFFVLKKLNWINTRNTLFKLKPVSIFLLILFLFPFVYKTYARNFDWSSTETLFKADISHLENSAKANESMGSIYLSKFRISRNSSLLMPAKRYYLQCVKVYPQYAAAWNNLGFINRYFGNLVEAEKDYLNAHKYNPENVITVFNIATFYQAQNNTEKAKQFYKKAIRINPDIPDLLPYLKAFIIKENLTDEFIPYLKELIDSTDNYNLQLLLIDLYNSKKDYNRMIIQLKKTYKKHPTAQLKQYLKEINRIFKK